MEPLIKGKFFNVLHNLVLNVTAIIGLRNSCEFHVNEVN